MSQALTVTHLIAGSLTEDTHTGDRITFQHRADGRALIAVYRSGRLTEQASYRHCERIHRRFHTEDDA
jgi:hypothetical protein